MRVAPAAAIATGPHSCGTAGTSYTGEAWESLAPAYDLSGTWQMGYLDAAGGREPASESVAVSGMSMTAGTFAGQKLNGFEFTVRGREHGTMAIIEADSYHWKAEFADLCAEPDGRLNGVGREEASGTLRAYWVEVIPPPAPASPQPSPPAPSGSPSPASPSPTHRATVELTSVAARGRAALRLGLRCGETRCPTSVSLSATLASKRVLLGRVRASLAAGERRSVLLRVRPRFRRLLRRHPAMRVQLRVAVFGRALLSRSMIARRI